MNWIDSHSRVDEGVTVGSCRINRLLFVDNFMLLESSQRRLQHPLDRFSAVYDRCGMKISAKQTEVSLRILRHSTYPRQSMLQVSGNILQQVEKFKYLGVVFASGGGRNKGLIKGMVKQTHFCVSFIALWSQNGSFQTLRSCQFSNQSLFRSSPVVWILDNDWKNIIPSAIGRDGILRRVHGVTLRDKVRNCEIRGALNVEPHLRMERSQLR